MKRYYINSTVIPILVVLLSTASAGEALAQKPANGAAKMVVSVTVPPICTVAVTPGEWSADEAIDVQCRNLPADHPQPVVTNAMPASDATAEVSEGSTASENPVAMVVINF
jgi:hypothetical protein